MPTNRDANTMPLSDVAVRAAKPQTKPVKLSDGGGLQLLIAPSGGKLWRLRAAPLLKKAVQPEGPPLRLSRRKAAKPQPRAVPAEAEAPAPLAEIIYRRVGRGGDGACSGGRCRYV